jgi:hypothetical protein
VPEPTKVVSSNDIDSASVADSGHGTSISEYPLNVQQASRHSNTESCIDSASIADSGRGPSMFSDQMTEDSLSLIDSEKATSMKEKPPKEKANVRKSVLVMHACFNIIIMLVQIPT